MSDQTTGAAPIALQSGEGEALWFLGALVTINAAGDTTAGRVRGQLGRGALPARDRARRIGGFLRTLAEPAGGPFIPPPAAGPPDMGLLAATAAVAGSPGPEHSAPGLHNSNGAELVARGCAFVAP